MPFVPLITIDRANDNDPVGKRDLCLWIGECLDLAQCRKVTEHAIDLHFKVLKAARRFQSMHSKRAAFRLDRGFFQVGPVPAVEARLPLEFLRRIAEYERVVTHDLQDRAYFTRLLAVAKERPDWSVLVGPEHLMVEAVQNGAQGGVNGGGNVWPQLLVQLYEAASSGDAATLARLQPQLATLDGIYRVGRHASAVVKGMKCSLSLLGICSDFMAEPFARFHERERQQVQTVLRKCGLLA